MFKNNYMRKDIYDNEISFHHSDIEFLEKHTEFLFYYTFQEKKKRGKATWKSFFRPYDAGNEELREHYDDIDSEGYVGMIKYSRTKKYFT